jgi:hypothetical protein
MTAEPRGFLRGELDVSLVSVISRGHENQRTGGECGHKRKANHGRRIRTGHRLISPNRRLVKMRPLRHTVFLGQ